MNAARLADWARRHGVGQQAFAELVELVGVTPPVIVQNEAHVAAAEAGVQACVRLDVDLWGGAVWRNNSGVAREIRNDGEIRPVRYGLGNDSKRLNDVFKSSDLIGLVKGGRFLAVDAKPRGWRYMGKQREKAQLAFHQRVREIGGLACFATCVEDVARCVNGG